VRADIRQLHRARRPGERLERPAPAVASRSRLPTHRARGADYGIGVFHGPHIPQRQGVRLPAAPELHHVPGTVLQCGFQLPVLLQPRRTLGGHHRTGPGQEHQTAGVLNGFPHSVFRRVRRVCSARVFLRVRRPEPQAQGQAACRPADGRRRHDRKQRRHG